LHGFPVAFKQGDEGGEPGGDVFGIGFNQLGKVLIMLPRIGGFVAEEEVAVLPCGFPSHLSRGGLGHGGLLRRFGYGGIVSDFARKRVNIDTD